MIYRTVLTIVFAAYGAMAVTAQTLPGSSTAVEDAVSAAPHQAEDNADYVLGPQDSVLIKVLNAEELGTLPYPIDLRGNLRVPMVGRVHAAGLTVEQFENVLTEALK